MEIAKEIASGIGGLFLQPLFYMFLIFYVVVHARRVRLERRDFHVRVYGVADGFVEAIAPGILIGLGGSALLLAAGVALPEGMIVLVAALYLLAVLTFQLRLVTPLVAVGLAVLFAYVLPDVSTGVGVLDAWLADIRSAPLAAPVLLLGVLMIVEAVFIRLWGTRTSPRLLPGKRGKPVGVHEARRFWVMPFFLLLPGGVIPNVDGWPFTADASGYSLLLVPFGFGFYRMLSDRPPQRAVIAAAKQRVWPGLVVLLLGALSLYTGIEWLAPVAVGLAMMLRLALWLGGRWRRGTRPTYFRQRNDGLVVLGVLPGSPADSFGIRVGECIHRVNGKHVRVEGDVYRALQSNSAYCKMEVGDEAGEIRIVQGALYAGSHHELGLLFVAEPKAARSATGG